MGVGSGRKKGTKSTGWIRDTVLRIYTEDQVREDWNAVTPAERLKLVGAWVPKEVKVDQDTKIRLFVNGLEQARSIDGRVINALEGHDPDDAT